MSFFSSVYQLLIGPIELLFELVFFSFNYAVDNLGLSIVILSLVMNFLLLPLYKRADAIQDAERKQEKDMADNVAHIKKTFSGDERFMMLQTYYRQNHYKPFYVLKGFLPLLLEIPFFIAAYHFLSGYEPLTETAFGPIKSLGKPDQLLSVAGITLNVLPILMTLINCVSSAIYTKGFPLKDKIQLYGMALLFLVLLYDSPAGLVIYWTMNNLFSLIKNLAGRFKKGNMILKFVLAVVGIALLIYGIAFDRSYARIPEIIAGVLLPLPSLLMLLKKRRKQIIPKAYGKPNTKLFVTGCVFLALLTGALIPSAVIVSSPEEFVHMEGYYSPLRHIFNAMLLSVGLFVVWFGIFYYMFSDRGKRIFGKIIWAFSGIAIVNYMFFGNNQSLTAELLYAKETPVFSLGPSLINLGILAALVALMMLIYRKKIRVAQWITVLMTVVIFGMSVLNTVKISGAMADYQPGLQSEKSDRDSRFSLSKKGKNVVFIMLDRAISGYVPYIFQEYPELKEQFSDFTYYPNALSYGGYTNFCVPSLYGGYDYTPEAMNRRNNMSLREKHDEALKVLPKVFLDAGYQVTVIDPPYAGYSWIPDLSIYDEMEGVHTYHAEHGQFSSASDAELDQIWQRNFFCYSIMNCCPTALQLAAYDNGHYFSTLKVNNLFERSYSALKALPRMTAIRDVEEYSFLTMNNSTTHEPAVLSTPDFEPAENWSFSVDDPENLIRYADGYDPIVLDTENFRTHYAINAAALIQVGKWLEYLRQEGVYNNTRIIIAADHGRDLGQISEMVFPVDGTTVDVMFYNPLFMVKDFTDEDGEHPFITDLHLVTIADVPALLTDGVIPNPVNPFTGNPITVADEGAEHLILASDKYTVTENNGNAFLPGIWYSVRDNIFDPKNWKKLGEW